ncbi:MAG: HAMP domain-containing sensor histidine kinase [Pseudomonadota bacterium]
MLTRPPRLSLAVLLTLIGTAFGVALSMIMVGQVAAALMACVAMAVLGRLTWNAYGWRLKHLDDLFDAFEKLPVPMAIYDAEERLILTNHFYRSHHSETKIDLTDPRLRPTYNELADGDEVLLEGRQRAQAKIAEAESQGISLEGALIEVEFPRIGWLRVGKRRLSGGGNVRVAIDINELKAREQDLERAVERAQAADKSKLQFLATMTHELRTPLNGVIGMSSVLLARDVEPTVRTAVETIRMSGEHLLDLVNRLLDYARMNNHSVDLEEETFDLRRLVEDVVNEARFSPHADSIDVTYTMMPGLAAQWFGSRIGLRQVLTNLVGNAVKFTPEGAVTVDVEAMGNILSVSVQDTGVGIAETDLKSVFLPFTKLNATQDKAKGGTGLGLAITEELVKGMSGSITIESEIGIGTCFIVQLPMTPMTDCGVIEISSSEKTSASRLPRAS